MVIVTTQAELPAGDGGTPIAAGAPTGDVDEPVLTVAAVARRLGIAPATLRTWDRRYGVGPRGHATGRHRRYGPPDVARLELMQRALLRGASPAEAARYALSVSLLQRTAPDEPRRARPAARGLDPALAGPLPDLGPDLGGSLVAEGGLAPVPHPRSTARLPRLPGASRPARGLSRAVLAMDSPAAHRLISDAIDEHGVVYAWDRLVRPVLGAIAQRWADSGGYVECEHLLHECALAALIRATPLVASPRNPRPVLLACAPGEQHSLPLYALGAALSAREVGTRMLGPALPAAALATAVGRIAPAVVVVWAQLPRYADPSVLAALPKARQRSRTFLAGPGWQLVDVDPKTTLPDSLDAATDELTRVVLGAKVDG